MEGKSLPAVTFTDHDGKPVRTAQLKAPYVLYAYPRDDTPGCTKEACGIRDAWSQFQAAGLTVYGISADDAESHRKFRSKYALQHTLLTATPEDLEKLGFWKEKSMYGRKYMGIARETYLVGVDGKVLRHYPKVKPEDHADELLADWMASQ